MKRDLTSLKDLSNKEILSLLDLTKRLKRNRNLGKDVLRGKTLGLVFQKPSNRTRVSFEVGIYQLGGKCIYLGPDEINMGVRESTEDTSKTLSRYLDGIIARVHKHQDIIDLTKHANVPIINGLSDLFHPCQGLADIFTIQEKFGKLKGLTVAYVGDGNNVCHSLMLACVKTGANINIAAPKGYDPSKEVIDLCNKEAKQTGAKVAVVRSPDDAVKNADVIYSDVWVSMGQEKESDKRLEDFKNYQVNMRLSNLAKRNHIFMHCLPAHRGFEVTNEVMDSRNSVVFDQAENRLHTQKAVLMFLFTNKK